MKVCRGYSACSYCNAQHKLLWHNIATAHSYSNLPQPYSGTVFYIYFTYMVLCFTRELVKGNWMCTWCNFWQLIFLTLLAWLIYQATFVFIYKLQQLGRNLTWQNISSLSTLSHCTVSPTSSNYIVTSDTNHPSKAVRILPCNYGKPTIMQGTSYWAQCYFGLDFLTDFVSISNSVPFLLHILSCPTFPCS